VSNWLVYAEGVREHIDGARARQAVHPAEPSTGASGSSAGLKTDLALARQEITALREERDKLKDAVRRQLGQQLDQVGTGELVARIDELSRQNAELTAERDTLTRGKAEWEEKLAEAEEDRNAPRASLRRMMRRENANPDAPEAG
jgi:chromosome segregation ATPase